MTDEFNHPNKQKGMVGNLPFSALEIQNYLIFVPFFFLVSHIVWIVHCSTPWGVYHGAPSITNKVDDSTKKIWYKV